MENKKNNKRKFNGIIRKENIASLSKEESSKFYINNIGPAIALLLSMLEGKEYHYKTIDYKGIDFYINRYDFDTIHYNGKCSIISTKDNLEIVERGNIGDFFDGKDTICLATSGFLLPPVYDGKVYQVPRIDPPNNMINFYDNEGNKLILFKEFPYVYDFIDLAMKKQLDSPLAYLSREDYCDLIFEIIRQESIKKAENDSNMTRKRV